MISNKIKVRCNSPKANREIMLRVLCDYNIKCSKIIKVNDKVLLVFCNASDDIDKMFSKECIAKLKSHDFNPIVPPDLQARRSLIVKNLDPLIYQNSVEDIVTEMEHSNIWLRIDSLYKFPNSRTIKVTCEDQEMVRKALSCGLLMFNLSIHISMIQQEEFVNLTVCYRCYKWNEHTAMSCCQDKNYKICSLCSTVGHVFHECTNSIKCCINCRGNHSTLSFACPVRKKIAAEVRGNNLSKRRRNSSSFSQVVNNTTVKVAPAPENIYDITVKSTLCVIISSLQGFESSIDYEGYLNRILQLNNLPKIIIGELTIPKIDTRNLINSSLMKDNSETFTGGSLNTSNEIIQKVSDTSSKEVQKNVMKRNTNQTITDASVKSKMKEKNTHLDEEENIILASESPVAAAVQRLMKMNTGDNVDEGKKHIKKQLRYHTRKDYK